MDGLEEVIDEVLAAARQVTGLELSFVGVFENGRERIAATAGSEDAVDVRVGQTPELEATYCQRMVDGRIPGVVPDAAAHPELAELAAEGAPRSYVGTPIRLRDGRLYGSLCVVGADAAPGLGEEHLAVMRLLSRFLADRVDDVVSADAERRAQDEFFAAVTHDLRNPLGTIRGYAELLDHDPDRADIVPVAADAIHRNALALDRLVEDLLTVARSRAGQFAVDRAPVALGTVVREAVEDARHTTGHAIGLDAEDVEVHGDAGRLRQLLDNVIGNAVKYSPGGEPVEVALRAEPAIALITVRDRGIGMAPEDLERVFERYVRAPSAAERGLPGLGLGLVIARAVVAAHEGTITADSALGEGTTFTIRLPRRAAA